MDGWKEGKAGLRIAYSNKKIVLDCIIEIIKEYHCGKDWINMIKTIINGLDKFDCTCT